MVNEYPENYRHLSELVKRLTGELRDPMGGFHSLRKSVLTSGALDHKTKELMALAIAIAQRAEGCLTFHVHDAIKAGASRQEILETIGVAIMMGGGPSAVYGSLALEAIDQFEEHGLFDESQRSYGP